MADDLNTTEEVELIGDDDSYDGGGFMGDSTSFGDLVSKETKEEGDLTSGDDTKKPEEAGGDPGKKDEKSPPATDTPAPALDVKALLAGQAAMFKDILEQNNQANRETLAKLAPAKKEEPAGEIEIPHMPTEDDMRDDPIGAADKIGEINALKLEKKLRKEREDDAAKAEEAANRQASETAAASIKESQTKSWDAAVKINEDLNKYSDDPNHVRNLMAGIYHNPELGLKKNPMGPFLASMAAIVLSNQLKSAKGATDAGLEESRQARVREGHVDTGGGGKDDTGKSGGKEIEEANLTKEDLSIIKQMGVKPESYISSLKQLGQERR